MVDPPSASPLVIWRPQQAEVWVTNEPIESSPQAVMESDGLSAHLLGWNEGAIAERFTGRQIAETKDCPAHQTGKLLEDAESEAE